MGAQTSKQREDPGPTEAAVGVGQVIADRYRLLEPLGRGGHGVVYRAVDGRTGGEVALKLLARGLADPESERRFEREATLLQRVRHPNVCRALDVGRTPDGVLFLVMESLRGVSLQDVLRDDARPAPDRVLRWLRDLAAAVGACHVVGIAHRDLKPENVMLVQERGVERVKLLDLGTALTFGEAALPHRITQRHFAVGTPGYMSPEQAVGAEVDGRSDVYAVGVLAYTLLAGSNPFERSSETDTIRAQMLYHPPPVTELDATLSLPDGLERLVERCLDKRPERRPPDGATLAAELDAIVERDLAAYHPVVGRWRHGPKVLILLAVLGLAVLLAAVLL